MLIELEKNRQPFLSPSQNVVEVVPPPPPPSSANRTATSTFYGMLRSFTNFQVKNCKQIHLVQYLYAKVTETSMVT